MPTWDQTADMEEGNLTDFDQLAGISSDLSASSDAPSEGVYGMKVDCLDTGIARATYTGPSNDIRHVFECALDINSLSMGNQSIQPFRTIGSGANAVTWFGKIQSTDAGYYLIVSAFDDGNSENPGSWISLPDAYTTIQVRWVASTAAGANSGYFQLFIDGILKDEVTGIDNDGFDIDRVDIGRINPSGSSDDITGSMYFDLCRWSDDIVHYIGGSIEPASTITKKSKRALAGVLQPAGTIIKKIKRALAGALQPAGTFVKKVKKSLAGMVSPVGTITKKAKKLLTGTVTPEGVLYKLFWTLKTVFLNLSPSKGVRLQLGSSDDIDLELDPEGSARKR